MHLEYLLAIIIIIVAAGTITICLYRRYGGQWFKRHKKAIAAVVIATSMIISIPILLIPTGDPPETTKFNWWLLSDTEDDMEWWEEHLQYSDVNDTWWGEMIDSTVEHINFTTMCGDSLADDDSDISKANFLSRINATWNTKIGYNYPFDLALSDRNIHYFPGNHDYDDSSGKRLSEAFGPATGSYNADDWINTTEEVGKEWNYTVDRGNLRFIYIGPIKDNSSSKDYRMRLNSTKDWLRSQIYHAYNNSMNVIMITNRPIVNGSEQQHYSTEVTQVNWVTYWNKTTEWNDMPLEEAIEDPPYNYDATGGFIDTSYNLTYSPTDDTWDDLLVDISNDFWDLLNETWNSISIWVGGNLHQDPDDNGGMINQGPWSVNRSYDMYGWDSYNGTGGRNIHKTPQCLFIDELHAGAWSDPNDEYSRVIQFEEGSKDILIRTFCHELDNSEVATYGTNTSFYSYDQDIVITDALKFAYSPELIKDEYSDSIRTDGEDYFIWMGDNMSAYDIADFLDNESEITFSADEYVAIWNQTGKWDGGWSYYKKITIDHTLVDDDLINFPILFSNISTDFISHAQSDGDDFLFVSSDNSTQYNHEIEEYNSTTGELIAWVNIPSLSSTVDTELYLYYGNPSCSSQQNVADTWNSDYIAVWHWNSDFLDSTANSYDGIPNRVTNVSGIVGGGMQNVRVPTDTMISIENFYDSSSDDTLTAEMWIKFDDNDEANSRIFTKGTTYNDMDWGYYFRPTADQEMRICFNQTDDQGGNLPGDYGTGCFNFWFYSWCTIDIDENRVKGYANTTNVFISDTAKEKAIGDSHTTLYMGNDAGGECWNGTFDETRVSKIVRSWEWMNVTFNTIYNSTTFLIVGSEQIETDGYADWYADGCWYQYHPHNSSGDNWTINTFDVIRVYVTDDDGICDFDMTPNGDIDYDAGRNVTLANRTEAYGANFTGYTNSTVTTLGNIAADAGFADGEVLAVWDDDNYNFDKMYVAGFGGNNATVYQYDVIYTMVGSMRYWEFGGV